MSTSSIEVNKWRLCKPHEYYKSVRTNEVGFKEYEDLDDDNDIKYYYNLSIDGIEFWFAHKHEFLAYREPLYKLPKDIENSNPEVGCVNSYYVIFFLKKVNDEGTGHEYAAFRIKNKFKLDYSKINDYVLDSFRDNIAITYKDESDLLNKYLNSIYSIEHILAHEENTIYNGCSIIYSPDEIELISTTDKKVIENDEYLKTRDTKAIKDLIKELNVLLKQEIQKILDYLG